MEDVRNIQDFLSSGSGDGSGSGYGSGDGSGSGYGSGDGYGYGDVKSFCGKPVYYIDGMPTLIDAVRMHGTVAKGMIIQADLTTRKCIIVKSGKHFAHGKNLREAMAAVREKALAGATSEERCAAFIGAHKLGIKYPCTDLYQWHHNLTGSCEMGRKQFATEHGIDIEHGEMTVEDFIELTKNAYGGDVIKMLANAYGIKTKESTNSLTV